jgi:hypothetical protein
MAVRYWSKSRLSKDTHFNGRFAALKGKHVLRKETSCKMKKSRSERLRFRLSVSAAIGSAFGDSSANGDTPNDADMFAQSSGLRANDGLHRSWLEKTIREVAGT